MRTLWKSGPKAEGGGWVDEVAEMYRVADDYEAQTLDELRIRAGITWECYGEDGDSCWTNHRDDPKCDRCGRPR